MTLSYPARHTKQRAEAHFIFMSPPFPGRLSDAACFPPRVFRAARFDARSEDQTSAKVPVGSSNQSESMEVGGASTLMLESACYSPSVQTGDSYILAEPHILACSEYLLQQAWSFQPVCRP
jgi:hypothetical protein